MAEAAESLPTIGHNSLLAFYAEQNLQLPEYLMRAHESLLARVAELEAVYMQRPNIVDNDDVERMQTDLGGKIAKLLKDAAAHKRIAKEPVAAGTKIVEDFFARVTAPLETAMRQVERSVNAYKDAKRAAAQRAKEDADRRAREAADEARRKQEEVQRVADEELRLRREAAPAAEQTAAYQDIVAAEQEATTAAVVAKEAEMVAATAAAPVTTIARGESGAKSIQRTTWSGEIEDVATLDLDALRPFIGRSALETAVRAFAFHYKGTLPLAGARIFEKTSTSFRA